MADTVWIDVRTPEENAARCIVGHPNIPHEEIEQGIKKLGLSHDQDIKLYCRTGRRSGIAAEALQKLGFAHAVNVGSLEDAMELLDNS